ncbi:MULTISPECIES: IS3 family transposase [Bradyrhizobium]|uniref:IS3 family transposase n=2 Tax=Bradyrhizobium TaxID=374 RepID=UPI003D1DE6FA
MCALAGVSRAGYYRHWRASAPRAEEAGVRDAIQRLALMNKHYGYRRIAAQMRREGWNVNHKRVLRLMREDNLLCLRKQSFAPVTTDSRHGWRVVANLARNMAPSGPDQLWVADITYSAPRPTVGEAYDWNAKEKGGLKKSDLFPAVRGHEPKRR